MMAVARGLARHWRVVLAGLVLVALGVFVAAELVHRRRFGHWVVPFTHHWDIETREARGATGRQYRARLTNWTFIPIAIERVRGERFLFWWRVPPTYRQRVERRDAGGQWRTVLVEDLGEERAMRPVEARRIGLGASIHGSYYMVAARGESDSLAGWPVLRDGDEVRFVILARLGGDEGAEGQRVFRSPPVVVRTPPASL
jgi:hypothetical protein